MSWKNEIGKLTFFSTGIAFGWALWRRELMEEKMEVITVSQVLGFVFQDYGFSPKVILLSLKYVFMSIRFLIKFLFLLCLGNAKVIG